MLPSRPSEGDRNTLPPISSLSSHQTDSVRGEPLARDTPPAPRLPLRTDEHGRDRIPPPSALEHRQTPPAGHLARQHPPRDMEPLRSGPYPRPGDDAYGPPTNSKFPHLGPPPPPFHRDSDRADPASDEGAWRNYDRPDPRFVKDPYSPRLPPAAYGPPRDDARSAAPWQRPSEDPHRPRMPGPPVAMRDEGQWRAGPSARDRPDVHPDAFAHERAREEERWRSERGARPMYPHENAPGFAAMPPYPHDARGAIRPLDVDAAEDARRIRRRATSSLMEDDQLASRYPPPPGARPFRPGTYSPPESRSQSAAPNHASARPGMMAGMEPPRPASTLGVAPGAAAGPGGITPPTATPATTVNANRRVAHLLSEQKRRESINTGFEDLRQAIPACRDGQDSKATILKRALEYIRELESVVERQHRPVLESHMLGGYSNRSPPDDKDDLRRFGRPGGEEDRRGPSSGRQMTGGSSGSSSDAGTGPRIGGLPSNAYATSAPGQGYTTSPASTSAPHRMREYRSYDSLRFSPPTANGMRAEPTTHLANGSEEMRGQGQGQPAKRWAEESDEDQRSPSRRRVSDGDKDEVQQRSPPGPNYSIARPGIHHARSPLMHSPKMEHARDWHARLDNKSLVDSAVRV